MKLIATKAFPYDGVRLKPGDEFETRNRRHGRVLIAIGRAKTAPDAPAESSEPQTVEPVTIVEDTTDSADDLLGTEPASEPAGETATQEAPQPRRRRNYRRRDITAESSDSAE